MTPDQTILLLNDQLLATTRRLEAYIKRFGPINGREDETIALSAIAIASARESDLISEDGRTSATGSFLPVDDDGRAFSDSILPESMIDAGIDQMDRIHADLANYVPGKTIDWDDGMIAVAVWRAMARAARERPFQVRLATDDVDAATTIQATDGADAARLHALATFHAHKGEWMGGGIVVTDGPDPSIHFFDDAYNADVKFVDGRETATVSLVAGFSFRGPRAATTSHT